MNHDWAKSNIRNFVYRNSGGHCWYCGKYLHLENTGVDTADMFTVDHIIPLIKGGTDDIDNLVSACFSCNGMKRARTLDEFRELMTRKQNNAPLFSDEQKEYLRENGIELPKLTPYIFYFEKIRVD